MGFYTISKRIARRVWSEGTIVKLEPSLRRMMKVWYTGKRYACPCCHSRVRRFLTDRQICPGCGSSPRHRLQWLYLEKEYDLFRRNETVLDIAPWRYFQRHCLRQTALRYHSMDIASPWALERGDLTALPYRQGTFQVVLCSHVLEHIPGDQAAMGEMHRILAPGGMALIQVPLQGERTFEDPDATSPMERERVYGRSDHVRIYGSDIKDRVRQAGFEVELVPYAEHFDNSDRMRYDLDPDEFLIIGKKP
ncbi:class I SAM-dependent methyltransferase [Candidatus Neomarinimicrobiota bacterium]